MILPLPITISEPSLEAFDWASFGSIAVTTQPMRFGFQLDVIPAVPHPDLVFGLVERQAETGALGTGFAIRIDLDRGEIWDIANNSGLVGWIDHPLGLPHYSAEEPMLLSWEVERIGLVLIPKLQVGGEEWLYPSIRCAGSLELTALAGCSMDHAPAHQVFLHPALWQEAPTLCS